MVCWGKKCAPPLFALHCSLLCFVRFLHAIKLPRGFGTWITEDKAPRQLNNSHNKFSTNLYTNSRSDPLFVNEKGTRQTGVCQEEKSNFSFEKGRKIILTGDTRFAWNTNVTQPLSALCAFPVLYFVHLSHASGSCWVCSARSPRYLRSGDNFAASKQISNKQRATSKQASKDQQKFFLRCAISRWSR